MSGAQVHSTPRIVVIGVGVSERGDDGVGGCVARRLSEDDDRPYEVCELRGEAIELMDAWADADAVVIVDAMHSGSSPGALQRFDASDRPLPARTGSASSHGLSVADAIELARAMESIPPRVVVFAIEGEGFTHGAGLSASVAARLDELVSVVQLEAERLAKELSNNA